MYVDAHRSVFLHEHDSDNTVQFSCYHRYQHAHPRRPKEHGSEMASPGNHTMLFYFLFFFVFVRALD